MHGHAMTSPPHAFTDAWDLLQFPFFLHIFASHHLDKASSLSHLSINTVPKLFASPLCFSANSNLVFLYLVLVRGLHLAVYICNSVSESPEDSRSSEHHPAFWKLLVILQTRLLGFVFTVFMICLSSTTVVFSADQVIVGCCCRWWFPNS